MNNRYMILSMVVGFSIFLAGCASTPKDNQMVDEAKAAYEDIRTDPDVARSGDRQLRSARDQLARAERLLEEGASTAEIEDGAVSFEQIFNIVSTTVASTSFIVFDACRTVMDDESRGMLRSYRPVTWSTGVFQAYATEPGKTAADDGAYSEELARRIPAAGLPANVLFKRVQDAVARRTNEQQHPNYIDLTTGGDFYFQPE